MVLPQNKPKRGPSRKHVVEIRLARCGTTDASNSNQGCQSASRNLPVRLAQQVVGVAGRYLNLQANLSPIPLQC